MKVAAFAAALLGALCTVTVSAQSRNRTTPAAAGCDDHYNSDRPSYCEVREETIATGAVNPLDVDAGQNGGIRVRGWDRPEVHMRARVTAWADTDAAARQAVTGVRVVTGGGSIHAEGPASGGNGGWSVSFELDVPRTAIVALHTHNGGISIADFQGTATFRAVNGGVSLTHLGGDIRGGTQNGGVTIDLSGDRWDGAGLDVETTNGGIQLAVPEHYSAALDTATTHGRVSIDFPVAVNGRINNHIETTLGAGGAKIRAVTTNGGVHVRSK